MDFIGSTLGKYLTQTLVYSLVVALVVETLIRVWGIASPQSKLKFRLLTLVLPLICWAVFWVASPLRESASFRDDIALLDTSQWLNLRLGGNFSLGYILLFLFALTTVLFLIQEAFPALRYYLPRRASLSLIEKNQFPKLDSALRGWTNTVAPEIFVTNRKEPMAYVTGTLSPVLVLSPSLIDLLEEEELKGVLAHEMAHILKGDHRRDWALLALRSLMFFNPVVLVVFRRITQENEQVCDDMAVSLTRNPLGLASGLIKVFRGSGERTPFRSGRRGLIARMGDLLPHHRYRIAEERLKRLLSPVPDKEVSWEGMRLGLSGTMLFGLLFFIV